MERSRPMFLRVIGSYFDQVEIDKLKLSGMIEESRELIIGTTSMSMDHLLYQV